MYTIRLANENVVFIHDMYDKKYMIRETIKLKYKKEYYFSIWKK